ncbi:uncharacterized protein BHQ10_001861 [Talaromyces amestolkiae]|uniref:Protein phosphatase 4 core regulatory subunit R2 n=1 Tax=Talaromyces amestolkiae TaxID=1196081 RepID=A0A364KQN0_TALAM|nr:uncharacterized protein BHQ10_001861 [Talaromyces amestolkiae]RAO65849.1 hypothetical protein BHQ10_001861 [Talaromyces amestolkiae]
MILDEDLLEKVAQDGSMNYDQWPEQLEPLIQRLDEIISQFPIPKVPPEIASSYASSSYAFHDSLQSSNKENAPPSPAATQTTYNGASTSTSEYATANETIVPNSQPSQPDTNSLPPPLLSLIDSIKSTLRTYFASKPPHTVQRLAELILRPTRQYRTLPAYLRAVDRVVSVSSSADIFPLPRMGISPDDELANGITNGARSSFMVTDESLGSDESLGGALLTPIPWLRNHDLEAVQAEMVAQGAVPLRADAAVTQGELIRQEQEAGLIATSQTPHVSSRSLTEKEEEDGENSSPQPEEIPHARGPSVLGVEDLGLQDGKGVEMVLSDPNKSQEEEKSEMDVSDSIVDLIPDEVVSEAATKENGADDEDIILDDQGTTSSTETSTELDTDATRTQDETG